MNQEAKDRERLRQELLKARTKIALMDADHHSIYENKEEEITELKEGIKHLKKDYARKRITAISEKKGLKDNDKHKGR